MPEHLELESELLRVVVAPAEGGRIVSLCSLESGVEFLWQSQHPFVPIQPGRDASFGQGACAGIEECLPTVSACDVDGEAIPDHGDFWQLAWKILPSGDANAVNMQAEGFSRPLRFSKRVALRGSCLRLEYRIENTGSSATSFHYATHPLLAIEAGDRILLPAEVSELTLHSSKDARLGHAQDRITWPIFTPAGGEESIDSSLILEPKAATAEMLYTDRLKSGWCALYRVNQRQGIVVRFDTAVLPYLGLWICCGGWPLDSMEPRQYAFAPEPTTAPCGSLGDALSRGVAVSLPAYCSFQFAIEFCISPEGLTADAFSRFASVAI